MFVPWAFGTILTILLNLRLGYAALNYEDLRRVANAPTNCELEITTTQEPSTMVEECLITTTSTEEVEEECEASSEERQSTFTETITRSLPPQTITKSIPPQTITKSIPPETVTKSIPPETITASITSTQLVTVKKSYTKLQTIQQQLLKTETLTQQYMVTQLVQVPPPPIPRTTDRAAEEARQQLAENQHAWQQYVAERDKENAEQAKANEKRLQDQLNARLANYTMRHQHQMQALGQELNQLQSQLDQELQQATAQEQQAGVLAQKLLQCNAKASQQKKNVASLRQQEQQLQTRLNWQKQQAALQHAQDLKLLGQKMQQLAQRINEQKEASAAQHAKDMTMAARTLQLLALQKQRAALQHSQDTSLIAQRTQQLTQQVGLQRQNLMLQSQQKMAALAKQALKFNDQMNLEKKAMSQMAQMVGNLDTQLFNQEQEFTAKHQQDVKLLTQMAQQMQACSAQYQQDQRLITQLEAQLQVIAAEKVHQEQVFSFMNITETWSRFGQDFSVFWQSYFSLDQSNVWEGVWMAVHRGQSYFFSESSQAWYQRALCIAQKIISERCYIYSDSNGLEAVGLFPGLGWFGRLTMLAKTTTMNDAISHALGLDMLQASIVYADKDCGQSPSKNATNLFMSVAELTIPRNVYSQIGQAANKRTFLNEGKMYQWDVQQGRLVQIADYTPAAVIAAVLNPTSQPALYDKIKLAEAVQQVMNYIQQRTQYKSVLQKYYASLETWYRQGGPSSGLPRPQLPPLSNLSSKPSPMVYQQQDPPFLSNISPWNRWYYYGRGQAANSTSAGGFMRFANPRCDLNSLYAQGAISNQEYNYLSQLSSIQQGLPVDGTNPTPWLNSFLSLIGQSPYYTNSNLTRPQVSIPNQVTST